MKWTHRLLHIGVVAAVALTVLLLPGRAEALSPNNFTIKSFTADYYLSRDTEKHSQLKVVEQITAEFPAYNQNHGIERAIPEKYNDHSLRLKIIGVTDEKGTKLPYKTNTVNHNKVLRIGDADTYVHGLQTYQISYSLQNVTQSFGDHDEIFWNTNGTQWWQPFENVTTRLHLEGVTPISSGAYQPRCVVGVQGSTESCTVESQENADGKTLGFTADRVLQPRENLSFTVGFAKDTFAAYTPTTWERIFPTLLKIWLVFNLILAIILIVLAVRVWYKYGRPPAGRGTIVPEYLPLKDISVLTAGTILKRTTPTTAQIIDLAVRHYLKIYEIDKKQFFGSKKVYELELVKSPADLREDERKFVHLIFGSGTAPGAKISTEALGRRLQKGVFKFLEGISKQAMVEGFYTDHSAIKKSYNKLNVGLLIAGLLLLSPALFAGSILMLIVVASLKPLSEKGVATRDYLEGLKMYMKLAEADRLRTLQSPEGAEKLPAGTDPTDKKQLVKLYERLLPYAVLYGIEKEWAKQFASLYDQPPEWYAGNWAGFNAGVFAASIGSFNTASNTTFAPPSSSSSSGFSGGSGGGGGGGGGGGW